MPGCRVLAELTSRILTETTTLQIVFLRTQFQLLFPGAVYLYDLLNPDRKDDFKIAFLRTLFLVRTCCSQARCTFQTLKHFSDNFSKKETAIGGRESLSNPSPQPTNTTCLYSLLIFLCCSPMKSGTMTL
jgi:hypothetical protein